MYRRLTMSTAPTSGMLASMLIRPHDDAADDEARWRRFVTDQGFGHFVAAGRDRAAELNTSLDELATSLANCEVEIAGLADDAALAAGTSWKIGNLC